jgi:transposase
VPAELDGSGRCRVGPSAGLTSDERKELVQLHRDNRRLETENEILRRAAALFAGDGIVPK